MADGDFFDVPMGPSSDPPAVFEFFSIEMKLSSFVAFPNSEAATFDASP